MLRRIYFWFMGPLYKRVLRDCTLQIQRMMKAQTEFQEEFSARICDQVLAISTTGKDQAIDANACVLNLYSIDKIEAVITRVHQTGNLLKISQELGIPLQHAITIYSEYGRLGSVSTSVRSLLELDSKNNRLSQLTLSLALENESLKSRLETLGDQAQTGKYMAPAPAPVEAK